MPSRGVIAGVGKDDHSLCWCERIAQADLALIAVDV